MKNRTIIGIICVVAALVVTFGVAPIVNRFSDTKIEVVRVKNNLSQGYAIKEDDIELVKVSEYNLPPEIIKDKSLVVGKYAVSDLYVGDYLTLEKLSSDGDSADEVFKTLDGTKQAMSITIQSFAGGLSAKLENKDIVSLVVYDKDSAYIPKELTYVRVITSTTASGLDKDNLTQNEDGSYELPTTLTLLVNTKQAELLAEYENNAKIHAILVYRGDDEYSHRFLDIQDKYFEESEKSEVTEDE